MIEDDNPVFLSFADALTCVLGASIALFLIFVTLVKVAPPAIDERRVSLAQTDRFTGAMSGIGAAAVVLRVASADCTAVRALELRSMRHDSWWTEQPGRNEHSCERIFRIESGATSATGMLALTTRRTEPLYFVLVVGARRWPTAPGQWQIEPGTSCRDDGGIARLALSLSPPLTAEGCSP